MSDKYIIKNCPVCEFSDWEECTGYLAEGYICNNIHTKIVECQDCTDCVMKQIVELCRKVQELEYQKGGVKYKSPSKAKFGREILKLFNIQEVE